MSGTGLAKLNLAVRKGATVRLPIRIETSELTWVNITGITRDAPVTITAPSHECPDGWNVAIVGVKGMSELNIDAGLKDRDFRRAAVTTTDDIQLNNVDSSSFKAYKSGGHIAFYAPIDLSAYATARMEVKDKVGGTQLLLLLTSSGGLEIDSAANTLWINMTAAESAALDFSGGVFDIELVTAGGLVKAVCSSESVLTVDSEVTTSGG